MEIMEAVVKVDMMITDLSSISIVTIDSLSSCRQMIGTIGLFLLQDTIFFRR